jgi:hypothetical protein
VNNKLIRYLVIFTSIYCALACVKLFVYTVFNIELGLGFDAFILISAAVGSAFKFTSDHQRPPNKIERNNLFWGSFSITLLLNATFFVLAWLLYSKEIQDDFSSVFKLITILSSSIVGILSFILAYILPVIILLIIIYGWGVNKYAQIFLKFDHNK